VEVAHGYAKATGKAMAAIVHNVVGLLHGTFGIYYAYLDRVPVIVGVVAGTYSSIFIASPLLVTWQEWEKDRKK